MYSDFFNKLTNLFLFVGFLICVFFCDYLHSLVWVGDDERVDEPLDVVELALRAIGYQFPFSYVWLGKTL